jgi:hypothetical protein
MRFAVLIIVVLLAAFTVSAQVNDAEIAKLKKQINIPAKDAIRYNTNAKLASGDSLKIFLAIKRPGSEAESFEKWIAEWNEKDGDKYGKLEIVKDISQANVILTQFVTTNVKRVEDKSVSVGNIPAVGQLKPKVRVKSETDYKTLKLPVYSYLIKREADVWTIIYGNVETSLPDEQFSVSPDLRLWQTFKEEMKSR